MSFRGATFGACGQQGMRTFRGPGQDMDGDFDVAPAPDAPEEGPPPLGLTPDPEGRPQSRSSAGRCFRRHWSRSHNLPSAGQSCARVIRSHQPKQKRICSTISRCAHMQAGMLWFEPQRVRNAVGRAALDSPNCHLALLCMTEGRFQRALLGL
jgi:hypothetical protein